jgi:hypothetical protein
MPQELLALSWGISRGEIEMGEIDKDLQPVAYWNMRAQEEHDLRIEYQNEALCLREEVRLLRERERAYLYALKHNTHSMSHRVAREILK